MATDIVRRNIELAFAAVRQAAADQTFAKELATRATDGPIVMLPADDTSVTESNRSLAARARQRGERVQEIEVVRSVAIQD